MRHATHPYVLFSASLLAFVVLLPVRSQAQYTRAQRQAAVAAWMQLPPSTSRCLRRNFGIFPRIWGWQYGIYPSDPSVSRQVANCTGNDYSGDRVAAPPAASRPQDSTTFQSGLADRTAWENWFNSLSGDEKIGAFYWAGQRSLPHPGSCNQMDNAFQRGCEEAVAKLSTSDVLRKSDPAYKLGWNSYTAPEAAPVPPAGQPATTPAAVPPPPPEPQSVAMSSAIGEEVPLETTSGSTYTVPTIVNGSVRLDFMIDSGASEMELPVDVVLTLMRSGTLTKSDFIGNQSFRLADGSTVKSNEFMLHAVKIGNTVVPNVVASTGSIYSTPLIGQSFLSRFSSWSVDNSRHVLILGSIN